MKEPTFLSFLGVMSHMLGVYNLYFSWFWGGPRAVSVFHNWHSINKTPRDLCKSLWFDASMLGPQVLLALGSKLFSWSAGEVRFMDEYGMEWYFVLLIKGCSSEKKDKTGANRKRKHKTYPCFFSYKFLFLNVDRFTQFVSCWRHFHWKCGHGHVSNTSQTCESPRVL